MNVNRYIAGLLFICFSAFLGHNLVPHHHLSEVICTPFATSKDQHPAHCHAFNDVVFEKFSSTIYNPRSSQIQEMVEPGRTYDSELLWLHSVNLYTFTNLHCNSPADRGPRALRAPPLFG